MDRALSILEALARSGQPMRILELSQALGIRRTTLYALVNTLEARGYVGRGPDGRLTVSGRLYELGAAYPARLPLVQRGGPHLDALARRYQVRVRLSLCTPGNRPVAVASSLPAWQQELQPPALHATGTGKLFLAYLPRRKALALAVEEGLEPFTAHTITCPEALDRELERTARRGYGLDRREFLDNTGCLAFPILRPDRSLEGILSVSTDCAHLEEVLDDLVREGLQRSKLIAMALADGGPPFRA